MRLNVDGVEYIDPARSRADYISEQAYDTLHAAGIKVTAVHKVSHHDFLKIWERMGETLDDNR